MAEAVVNQWSCGSGGGVRASQTTRRYRPPLANCAGVRAAEALEMEFIYTRITGFLPLLLFIINL